MSTDDDWEAFARESPYWAVLSDERFRDESLNDENKKLFFASGEDDIGSALAVLKQVFQYPDRIGTALDFGCGVGRLLLPLARRSRRAIGVDVSDTMLRVCTENARAAQLTNVVLVKGDDALSRLHEPFDLLSSAIVFQHIPVERGFRLLSKLLGLLKPGGGRLPAADLRERDRPYRGRDRGSRRAALLLLPAPGCGHSPAGEEHRRCGRAGHANAPLQLG